MEQAWHSAQSFRETAAEKENSGKLIAASSIIWDQRKVINLYPNIQDSLSCIRPEFFFPEEQELRHQDQY